MFNTLLVLDGGYWLPNLLLTSSVSETYSSMCLAFSSNKPRFKPAYELLDQFNRIEPVVFPKSNYECFLQLVFYTIVALVSMGCLGIISLSVFNRGDLAYTFNKMLWCLIPALFLVTYMKQQCKRARLKLQ